MNQPLGNKVGNALEIEETLDLLKGHGPADLLELVLTLGSHMVVMGGKATTLAQGREMLAATLTDGSALAKFKAMIEAQGGNGQVVTDYALMPHAKYQVVVSAPQSGVITSLSADGIGIAALMLGGGRQKADDQLDYGVGIELHKKLGDEVKAGEPLLTIHANQTDLTEVKVRLAASITIGSAATVPPLIHQVIE